MPKGEEIRIVSDNIRDMQREIDVLKKDVDIKQKGIKHIRRGQDELVKNDTGKCEKNESLISQI